jgi:hypothetical protein
VGLAAVSDLERYNGALAIRHRRDNLDFYAASVMAAHGWHGILQALHKTACYKGSGRPNGILQRRPGLEREIGSKRAASLLDHVAVCGHKWPINGCFLW